jgi:hypothetical protein
MTPFAVLPGLQYNRGAIEDPAAYARERGSASWLFLVGDEFASMPGGMSFDQVRDAVPQVARVVSDPPLELTLDLARQHVAALDALPRPTLVSCRTGPRASAVVYMYSGLARGADAQDVIDAAAADGAPFMAFPVYQAWVRSAIETLRQETEGSDPVT